MIDHHHYNGAERALIRHQLSNPRETYPPVRVRCERRRLGFGHDTCLSVASNGVITFFTVRRVHGVWEFRAVGGVA